MSNSALEEAAIDCVASKIIADAMGRYVLYLDRKRRRLKPGKRREDVTWEARVAATMWPGLRDKAAAAADKFSILKKMS